MSATIDENLVFIRTHRHPINNKGHWWWSRGRAVCPDVCLHCGALSGTDKAFKQCKPIPSGLPNDPIKFSRSGRATTTSKLREKVLSTITG